MLRLNHIQIGMYVQGVTTTLGAKMDSKAHNKFINEHKDKYTHVSQRSDGAVYLHDKHNVEVVSPQYSGKFTANTFEIKKWNKIWINSEGILIVDELKPPYKHSIMIIEWFASGRTKVVEQRQTFEGRDHWTKDTNPTWLAEAYRFAPDIYDVIFYRFSGESKIYKAETLPPNAIAVYQTKSEVRPTEGVVVDLERIV